jgi:non-ribosomal peptide synthetase component F
MSFPNLVHRRFETQVRRTAGSMAVSSDDQSLKYHTLNEEANRIAHHLQQHGVKPETTVGICLQRMATCP